MSDKEQPPPSGPSKEFSEEVKTALDSVIFSLTGSSVLEALYRRLREQYDITPDEVPYRLDTVVTILQTVFGVKGTKTIEKATVKRLFQHYGLDFVDSTNFDLSDYMELAKKQLATKSNRD